MKKIISSFLYANLSSRKIICLRVTNLFAMLNYLFAMYIKLFRDVDPFVCDVIYSIQLNIRGV